MNADRSASELEIRPIRTAADSYDVAILGGGLAGLTLGAAAQAGAPRHEHLHRREARGPGARGRLQGRRVDAGGLLQLLRRGARLQGPPRGRADPQVRPALLVPGRRQQRPLPAGRARPAPPSARSRATSSTAASSRTSSATRPGLPGSTCSAAPASRTSSSAAIGTRSPRHRAKIRSTTEARWVVDACGRAFFLKHKLDLLEDNGHVVNASWFRLAGGLDLEDWVDPDDEEWFERMEERGLRQH